MTHIVRQTHYVDRAQADEVGMGILGFAVRIVYMIAGVITGLLAIRFILALFGANPSNAFANFIYTTSHPFVTPFFGLFNYHSQYGISRFELETLIAIVVYSLAAWLIAKLLTVFTGSDTIV